ncbi:MAG: hypothetical protein M3Q07_23325, partial [Pseudobdellovibrionaceae bacterium]|nr:hypothetical protein [Pseudobdellovibrionaceae bacterium]
GMCVFLDLKHSQPPDELFPVSFHGKNIISLLALEPCSKILCAVKGVDGHYFAANIDRMIVA